MYKDFLSTPEMIHADIYERNIKMNYSTFEEQLLKQKRLKGKEKRNNLRNRVEKSRNRFNSDIESDAGSDGLAVHSSGSSLSGGSGRSGDWGPPISRHKPKGCKKRCERNSSFSDSGISSRRTSPELSTKDHGQKKGAQHAAYRHLISNNVTRHSGECLHNNRFNPAMTRARSCSVLPAASYSQSHEFRGRTGKRPSIVTESVEENDPDNRIEDKEKAILEQLYKNAGLIDDCEKTECNYVVDFSVEKPSSQSSKFPLPEHLNYPLCKYRHQSESALNKPSPMKKLRNGLKKLKPKRHVTSSVSSVNDASSSFSSDGSNYSGDVLDSDDDNDAILDRLSRNPKERKSLMKKLFGKLNSKTYVAANSSGEFPTLKHSISTRSIPDALKGMWNKVHEDQVEESIEEPVYPGLTRAKSMPVIPVFNSKSSDNIPERKHSNNIFTNFFKPIEDEPLTRSKSKQTLLSGNDVITRVLGMESENDEFVVRSGEKLDTLNDADLSSVSDTIDSRDSRGSDKEFVFTSNKGILKNNPSRKISSTSTLSSEYSSGSHNSIRGNVVPPPVRKTSLPIMTQHCPCCNHPQVYYAPHTLHNGHGQQFVQYVYAMPYPPQGFQEQQHYVDNARVVAPLDIRVSNQRKAERRKISEMLFDTFV